MIVLEVQQADVTRLDVDAITNAANTQLKHGGGVALTISRAGGPAVQRESTEKAPIGLGDAVETTAGAMPAQYVIHAATMELGGPTSAEIIARATRSTLSKADEGTSPDLSSGWSSQCTATRPSGPSAPPSNPDGKVSDPSGSVALPVRAAQWG